MLKTLGSAMPKHTSAFNQDFLQLIFQFTTGGPLPTSPPLKLPIYMNLGTKFSGMANVKLKLFVNDQLKP